jgi:hypothetical protein
MSHKPIEKYVLLLERYFNKWIITRDPNKKFNVEFTARCEREINGKLHRQCIYHGDGIYIVNNGIWNGKNYITYEDHISLEGITILNAKYI